jgi:hypothetical protein
MYPLVFFKEDIGMRQIDASNWRRICVKKWTDQSIFQSKGISP